MQLTGSNKAHRCFGKVRFRLSDLTIVYTSTHNPRLAQDAHYRMISPERAPGHRLSFAWLQNGNSVGRILRGA